MSANNGFSQILQPDTLLYRSRNGGGGWRETESRLVWESVVLCYDSSVIVVMFFNMTKWPELKPILHLKRGKIQLGERP